MHSVTVGHTYAPVMHSGKENKWIKLDSCKLKTHFYLKVVGRITMYGRSTAEIKYVTEDPEYLEAKAMNPIKLINKLLKHANT